MAETVLAEVECLTTCAADIDFFQAGKIYTIDVGWAKRRDIIRYFRPLREVTDREAEERLHDEVLPARAKAEREHAAAMAGDSDSVVSNEGPPSRSTPGRRR